MKPRTLGVEEVEKEQKAKQKEKAMEKSTKGRSPSGGKTAKESEIVADAPKKPASAPPNRRASTGKKVEKKKVGTKHLKSKKMVDPAKKYSLEEAVALLKKMKYTSFDESVEIHMNVEKTGLKGEAELPHATGKTVRVAIVNDAVLNELENGKMNFDILITHPSFMPKLAKYAKVLGPKGLMPNPKAGTISPTPEEVAKKFLKGTLRWRTEPKFPLIHQMVGKLSYEDTKLIENLKAFIEAVGKMHIFQAYLSSTMTPGVRIDLEKV